MQWLRYPMLLYMSEIEYLPSTVACAAVRYRLQHQKIFFIATDQKMTSSCMANSASYWCLVLLCLQ